MDTMTFARAGDFDTWLADNHKLTQGIWIKMAKVGSGIPSITSDEAVDIGLCWGWISGQRKSYDEKYYLQKYVPRRPRSIWSQVNVKKVEGLIESGKMQAPGFAEVEAAKADGRWGAAYASQRNATTPPDLLAALAGNKAAKAYYEGTSRTDQYAVMMQLTVARTPAARATKLKKIIAKMENTNN